MRCRIGKKNAQKIRAYIYKKKKEIDRSIDLFKALASNNERFNFDTGIVLLSNNNVDDDEELSDHRRVPPRVPLSSVCRSMAPEHVGCRDTRETPARGVGKERRRERERDLQRRRAQHELPCEPHATVHTPYSAHTPCSEKSAQRAVGVQWECVHCVRP